MRNRTINPGLRGASHVPIQGSEVKPEYRKHYVNDPAYPPKDRRESLSCVCFTGKGHDVAEPYPNHKAHSRGDHYNENKIYDRPDNKQHPIP